MTITEDQAWAQALLDECDDDDCLTCDLARALLASEAARVALAERLENEMADIDADALAEVQRLREENNHLKALLTPPGDVPSVTIDAIVYNTFARDRFGGDEPLVPADALNAARAERDAALALVEKLKEEHKKG